MRSSTSRRALSRHPHRQTRRPFQTRLTIEPLEERALLSVTNPGLMDVVQVPVATAAFTTIRAADSAPVVSNLQVVDYDMANHTERVLPLQEAQAAFAQLLAVAGDGILGRSAAPAAGVAATTRTSSYAGVPIEGLVQDGQPVAVPQAAFGMEDRSHVAFSQLTTYPFRANARLYADFGNGQAEAGSATMIDPYHAITAGHTIFSYEVTPARWAETVTISPAQDGDIFPGDFQRSNYQPYGQAIATHLLSFTGWTQNSDAVGRFDFDLGLVTLDRNIGNFTGWYGIGYPANDNVLEANTATTIGYPGADSDLGTDGVKMFTETGYATTFGVTEHQLRTNTMDVTDGQSGSGVSFIDQTVYAVVSHGHTEGGVPQYNAFTRITENEFNSFVDAMAQDNTDRPPVDRPDLVDYDTWFAKSTASVSDTTPSTGESVTVQARVRNNGTAAAGSFNVRFRLSKDTSYSSTDDYFLGDVTVSSLGAFANANATVNANVPNMPIGKYYLVWNIDSGNTVDEYIDNDNTSSSSFQITVTPPPDAYEANDSFATASSLGSLGVIAIQDLTIHAPNNDDYYRFTASAMGMATVAIAYNHLQGDLSLHVYDANQNLLDENTYVQVDSKILEVPVEIGQTYYVRVNGYDINQLSPDYSMSVAGPSIYSDDFEPNDSFAAASNLGTFASFSHDSLTIHEPDNDDYYSFVASTTGAAHVSISFLNSAGDLDLYTYDGAQNSLVDSLGTDDSESATFPIIAGQTYYVKIHGYAGAVNEHYLLSIVEGDPEIDVKGNSVSIADGDLAPSTTDDTDFGHVNVGSSVVHTFTIFNTANVPLLLSGTPKVLLDDNTNFTVLTQPDAVVPAGGSTTFQIQYAPATAGAHVANVSIASNDPNESPYNFAIQGNSNVAVLQAPTTGGTFLVTSPPGTRITASVSSTAGVTPPSGVAFPFGFLTFTVSGLTGATADVTISGLDVTQVTNYYKYGATPANHTAHWYDFLFGRATDSDSAANTGMSIVGSDIILHLVDGQRGDDDLAANGVIVDIGGPVLNHPPVATNDPAITNKNNAVAINVLGNDSDSDGTIQANTVAIVSPVGHGTTSVNPTTGVVTYAPAANYFGLDSFSYTVKDNLGATSNVATVSITVNAPPLAANDNVVVIKNTPLAIGVLGNDSDPDGTLNAASVTVVGAAGHGTTSVNPTTGVITYNPAANYKGPDSFTYKVKDNLGAVSNVATVSIIVNTPPTANNDTVSTYKNTPTVVSVLANDSDPDGTLKAATVAIVTAAGHGTTTINPTTGAITYTPAANYTGPDSFTYKVKDNLGTDSNVATVSITVIPTGSIAGKEYLDVTGNGPSADDTPLSGVKVYLDANNNGAWNAGEPTATTIADGSYLIPDLIAGTYKVRQVTPTGYVRTAPATVDYYSVALAVGQNSSGNNFSNAALGNPTALANVVYLINGMTPVSDLRGATKEGDTIQVTFTVVAGATPQRFTLVSYTAAGSAYDLNKAAQQKIFDVDSGVFGPGTYTLSVSNPHSYFQVDFVSGWVIDRLGPANSNIFYTSQNRLFSADNGGTHAVLAAGAALSGSVYRDANNNGLFESGELPLAGVKVTATAGSATQTVVTDVYGAYTFDNLPAGTYTITETQPGDYTDGKDTLGNKGGTVANDKFSGIVLAAGVSGSGYNFGEQRTIGSAVAGNQTGSLSFWNSSSGQALIKALNGGQTAKNLGNWLAANFNNLFGADEGSANNLSGKTNAQVAAYYQSLYSNAVRKPEAETLAVALAVYVTNSGLAGTTGTSYGFAVSATGLGAATASVGASGAAFGLNSSSIVTIAELLSRANARARKGVVWDASGDGNLNSAESVLRNQAASLFDSINNA